MTNTFQTNTFTNGMNLDTDITMIPDNQYRYAENVRIITDTTGTTGVLQNVLDTQLVEGGDFLHNNGEKVIATTTINQYGVILTVNDSNINTIYRIEDYNNTPLKHVTVVKGKLDYNTDSNVKIVGNYESEQNINIYIAAPGLPIRTVNVMTDKYQEKPEGNTTINPDGTIKNNNALDINTSVLLVAPIAETIGVGQLTAGVVQYAYQLFNVRGTESSISPVSNAVHITPSDPTDYYQNIVGANKGTNCGKGVTIKINLKEIPQGLYDNIRIFRVKYEDFTELPIIEVCGESTLRSNSNYYRFTDVGIVINTITLEEFNRTQEMPFTAATIESKNNILFAANVEESTWKPKYDARAYRFTKGNKLILKGGDSYQNISETVSQSNLNKVLEGIPEDYDCICPYNYDDWDFDSNELSKYQFGGTKLGGTGLNVSYEFVTTDLGLDFDFGGGLSIRSARNYQLTHGTVNSFDGTRSWEEPNYKFYANNYTDPLFSFKYKSYQRDEIYRFGIVFYNENNAASPVYWIADIRFPHCYESSPWFIATSDTSDTLLGSAIGVRFTVNNVPEGTKSFQIVRCKRNKEDRTILFQALCSATTSYPWYSVRNADKEFRSENDRRPLTFLSNSSFGCGAWTPLVGSSLIKWIDNNRVDHSIINLISPEIDSNQDDIAGQLKGLRADLCFYLDPRYASKKEVSSRAFYGVYLGAKTNQNQEGDVLNQTAVIEPASTVGHILSSIDSLIVASDGEDRRITNLIGKRYLAHYTDIHLRGHFNIQSVISPNILQNRDWENATNLYNNIEDKQYLNVTVSQSTIDNNQNVYNKVGYFGKNVVIKNTNSNIGPINAIHVTKQGNEPQGAQVNSSTRLYGYLNEYNKTYFCTPIVNIKTNNVPYEGNTYSVRQNSTYIGTSSYLKVTNINNSHSINVFGGDTYLGILDHKTVMYIPQLWKDVASPDQNCAISVSDYIPFETTINVSLLYGSSASRTTYDGYVDPYLAVDIRGGSYGGHTQKSPYFAYNDAYSVQPDAQMFVSDSNYSIANLKSGCRIKSSEIKTSNEVTDSWTKFKVANYLDVETKYGDITNLKNFNNQLFFWQRNSVGVVSVNERSLITDNNQSALVLGIGGVLDRFDYVTTTNGTDVINDKSIINTPYGLYWYDDLKNEICSYSNSVQKLSKVKSVQSWLNTSKQHSKVSVYDAKFNEVQFGFQDDVIVYDEQIQQFTSFRTFNPDNYLSFSDKLLYIKDQKIVEKARFPLSQIKSKLQIVVNKDQLYTKTFDNVFFSGEFTDVQKMMKEIKFTTKTQESTIFKDNAEVDNPIEQREDTFRFAVGRENNHVDNMSLPGRMKGKYLICDYLIDCSGQRDFILPNINTTYRYSLI